MDSVGTPTSEVLTISKENFFHHPFRVLLVLSGRELGGAYEDHKGPRTITRVDVRFGPRLGSTLCGVLGSVGPRRRYRRCLKLEAFTNNWYLTFDLWKGKSTSRLEDRSGLSEIPFLYVIPLFSSGTFNFTTSLTDRPLIRDS